jgi:hypothetical protein
MKQKTITVDISPDGAVKIEGHNFSGAECTKATAFLEDALGTKGASTKKPEYNRKEEQRQTVKH